MDRLLIPLDNEMSLAVERNSDSNKLFIGTIMNDSGEWWQDLAIVCPFMGKNKDKIQIMVFADKDDDRYTNNFFVGLYREDEQDG